MSKKLTALVVGAAALFSLTACAPSSTSASSEGVTLTVKLAEQSTYEGIRACIYDVTVTNDSGEDIERFAFQDGSTYKEPNGNIGAQNVDSPRENIVRWANLEGIAAGETVTFTDAFLCPEGQETTSTMELLEVGKGRPLVTIDVTV